MTTIEGPLREPISPGSVVFTSQEMPYGQLVTKEVELGKRRTIIEVLSRK